MQKHDLGWQKAEKARLADEAKPRRKRQRRHSQAKHWCRIDGHPLNCEVGSCPG